MNDNAARYKCVTTFASRLARLPGENISHIRRPPIIPITRCAGRLSYSGAEGGTRVRETMEWREFFRIVSPTPETASVQAARQGPAFLYPASLHLSLHHRSAGPTRQSSTPIAAYTLQCAFEEQHRPQKCLSQTSPPSSTSSLFRTSTLSPPNFSAAPTPISAPSSPCLTTAGSRLALGSRKRDFSQPRNPPTLSGTTYSPVQAAGDFSPDRALRSK